MFQNQSRGHRHSNGLGKNNRESQDKKLSKQVGTALLVTDTNFPLRMSCGELEHLTLRAGRPWEKTTKGFGEKEEKAE
ncbi:hypothetical protein STEG23_024157 [Scotinomys teguina]